MAIGIGIGIPFRRILNNVPALPTGLSSSFTVDTISGDLTWTDNSGGKAQYEIYSSTNGGAYTLLTTTAVGATSYSDTTCKQNASVIYKIRAKKGLFYSDYITATTVSTPLCWKTNQTVRTTVRINSLVIDLGKTVNIDWGDGSNNDFTGTTANFDKIYAASDTNIFNIKISGDVNSITSLRSYGQLKNYGDLTNWILPISLSDMALYSCSFTGNITSWSSDNEFNLFYNYLNDFAGVAPNIKANNYALYTCMLTSSDITVFRASMINFNIKNQKVSFPTSEIDKLLKAAADWYQVNTPTANCTYDLSGTNMGIPTGGASNVDIVRLSGYYTSAGKTATIVCRTS